MYVTFNLSHKPAREYHHPLSQMRERDLGWSWVFHSASTHWGLNKYQVQGMAREKSWPGVDVRIWVLKLHEGGFTNPCCAISLRCGLHQVIQPL